jgi:hypothetical protein
MLLKAKNMATKFWGLFLLFCYINYASSNNVIDVASACPTPDQINMSMGQVYATVRQGDLGVLANVFTCVVVELTLGTKISIIASDFEGHANFGKNTLSSSGVVLEREDGDGVVWSSAFSDQANASLSRTQGSASINLSNIKDASGDTAVVHDSWVIFLEQNSRSFTFTSSARVIRSAQVRSIRHSWYLEPASIYGLFGLGVVQMMNNPYNPYYVSNDRLPRLYALGGFGDDPVCKAGNVSIDFQISNQVGQIVLMSSEPSTAAPLNFGTGVQFVLAGAITNSDALNQWTDVGWRQAPVVTVTSETCYASQLTVTGNNADFPAGFVDMSTTFNLPFRDLWSLMTSIYGSPVGSLCTAPGAVIPGNVGVGQIATTIARPHRGYPGTYNYFDPDTFLAGSAILISGDAYLQEQVKRVLLRSGEYLKPTGQLPHHFEYSYPIYQALSGEIMTGPNVFWIKTCFAYAKHSGDLEWLREYMPTLRLASAFLFDLIDPDVHLAFVPGSLMIDVYGTSKLISLCSLSLIPFHLYECSFVHV